MRILVAEDDKVSRKSISYMLQKHGHEVVETCDGFQAWQKMQEKDSPRLLILDIMMPEIDGLELCRKIRSDDGYNPPYIILLTAKADKEDIVQGLEAGANDYITKPFDFEELEARINVGQRMLQMQSVLMSEINEHKLTAKRLHESEQLLEESQRISRLGGWEYDVRENKITWTDEVYRIYGVSKDNYDPNNLEKNIEFYAPEERNKIEQALTKAINKGESYDLELRFFTAQGDPLWVRTMGRPVVEKGQVKKVVGNIMDITLYKEARDKLEKSEAKFRSISLDVLDSSAVALFILDKDFKIVWINKATSIFFGLNRQEMIGKDKRELINNYLRSIVDEPDNFVEILFRTYEDNNYAENFECHIVSGEGRQERWLEHFSQPIKSGLYKGGRVEHYYDITERKLADKSLRERLKELRCIYSISQDIQKNFSVEELCRRSVENLARAMKFPEIAVPVIELNGSYFTGKGYRRDLSHYLHTEIKAEGQARGNLWIFYTEDRPFLIPEEQDLINVVAENIGVWFENKRINSALRENEEKYKKLINTSPEGVALVDKEGRFLTVNPAMAERFGLAPEELEGKTHHQVMPKGLADQRLEKGKEAVEKEKLVYFEDKRANKNFQNYYVPISTSGGQRTFQVISRDITKIRQTQNELEQTLNKLNQSFQGIFHVLSATLELRDAYTAGHQERVTYLACAIAREMDLEEDRIQGLYLAGMVHDIGKISVPAEILAKPTRLTDIEFGLIKDHVRAGYNILKDIEFPWPIADIVLQHHERLDGSGYPAGLFGEDILLESRILAVADVVEAMTSHRPYRPGLGLGTALQEVERTKGLLFDEKVVDTCIKLFKEKGYTFEGR